VAYEVDDLRETLRKAVNRFKEKRERENAITPLNPFWNKIKKRKGYAEWLLLYKLVNNLVKDREVVEQILVIFYAHMDRKHYFGTHTNSHWIEQSLEYIFNEEIMKDGRNMFEL